MKEVEMNLFTIGACVSTICVIALLITCCIIPKWSNNMVNFVSAHQILFGTAQLVCVSVRNIMGSNIVLDLIALDYYFLLMSVCWSFCAAFFAYCKYVDVKTQLCYDKRIAIALSYGMFLFVILFNAVIPSIITLKDYINDPETLKFISIVVMLAVNCIVCSCIYGYIGSLLANRYIRPICSRSDSETLRAVTGVALNCDVIAFAYFVAMWGWIYTLCDFMWMYDIYLFATVMYCLRITLLTIHTLFSQISMDLYKSYFDRPEIVPEIVN